MIRAFTLSTATTATTARDLFLTTALAFAIHAVGSTALAEELPTCSTASVKSMSKIQIRDMIKSCNLRLRSLSRESDMLVARWNRDPKKARKDKVLQTSLASVKNELEENQANLMNLRYHRALLVVNEENTRLGFHNVKQEATEPKNPDVTTATTKSFPPQSKLKPTSEKPRGKSTSGSAN